MATRRRGGPLSAGILAGLLSGLLATSASAQAMWRGAYDDDGYAAPGWRATPDSPAYDEEGPAYRMRPGWTYRERTYYRRVYRYRAWPQEGWSDEDGVAPTGRDPDYPSAPRRGRTAAGVTVGNDGAYEDGRDPVALPGEAPRRPKRQSRPVRLPVARPATVPAPVPTRSAAIEPPARPAKPAAPPIAHPAVASDPVMVTAAGAPVALPVPRPNLEGLDFAPSAVSAAPAVAVPGSKAL